LTYKSFLDKYKNLLTTEGKIKLKTDNDLFFASSLESMEEYGMALSCIINDLHNSKFAKDNETTGYEEK
jgi:tRNA (guanine-N7-)-methyltransferase